MPNNHLKPIVLDLTLHHAQNVVLVAFDIDTELTLTIKKIKSAKWSYNK